MPLLIDILLAGIVLGGMYALIAMGLTLQYGVARIMNLSHGEGMIAAAFGAHWAFTAMALSPLLGLVVAMPLAFAASWFIYQIVLMPLVRRAKSRAMLEVDSILATFGLLFVLQGIMLVMFGGQFYTYTYLSVPVDILGSTVALNRLIARPSAGVNAGVDHQPGVILGKAQAASLRQDFVELHPPARGATR